VYLELMKGTSADLAVVTRVVSTLTGWGLSGESADRVVPVIEACMREAGYGNPANYASALQTQPSLLRALTERLSIGESYFFRHPWHFDLIEKTILPEAERRRAEGEMGLAVWSAGCADGQEIYSVAILLAEAGLLEHARLHATDISAEAVARARAGRYRDWALRSDESARAKPWMRREDEKWVLAPTLRESVRFSVLNLAHPLPAVFPRHFDVILCRNVMIYFDAPTIGTVAQRLCSCLRPGGWLLTGPSDPPLSDLECLDTVTLPGGVAYRRPPTGSRPPDRPVPRPRREARVSRSSSAAPERSTAPDLIHLRRMADMDPAHALLETKRARRKHPEDVGLSLLEANLCIALGRPQEAQSTLRRVVLRAPRTALAHYMLASLELTSGDRARARASFERALEEASRLPAEQLLEHGDGERAGRLADAARRQLASLGSAS
jgi:chemotaxis protein methyltransferase CheR